MPKINGTITDDGTQITTTYTGNVTDKERSYYFDDTQDGMVLTNNGTDSISLNIEGEYYSVQGGSFVSVTKEFYFFSIKRNSVGTHTFTLSSYILKNGITGVEDTLTSTNKNTALSANQGNVLKGLIDTNTSNIATNAASLADKAKQSDLDTTNANVASNTANIATNTTAITGKADKTYTDNQLALKRDISTKITNVDLDTSTNANKIKLINLADEVTSAITGSAPVNNVIADGSIGTTKYADGSFNRQKSKTSLGSMQDGIYFNTINYYMTRSGTDIKLLFPSGTVAYYKNIERRDTITLSVLSYTIPHNSSLVYTITDQTQFYIKNTDTLTINDVILLSNHGGVDKINRFRKYQDRFNEIVFTSARATYVAINSNDVSITFSGDLRLFLRTGDGLNPFITIPQATYTLPTSNALVFNLYNQAIEIRSWDSLLLDDVVLVGNFKTNLVQNNIGVIPVAQNIKFSRVYDDDVLYYASKVTLQASGSSLIVNFSTGDQRLFYKTTDSNSSITLSTLQYTVPHNSSLVLNRDTKILEIINTDSIVRGTHWVLVTCHSGLPKKLGLRIENSINSSLPTSSRTPKQIFNFPVNQDGCLVGNEIWMFDGGNADHTGTANVHRLNKDTLVEIGTISHNLGHCNGADYKNGKLLLYNGSGLPPELCLYSNPIGKTSLNLTDSDNLQLVFKEGSKQLEGDGSACFGESERIVYYACNSRVYKILLGTGDNDLSDKTVDKSDMTLWGTFQSGKATTEYNGTAKVLGTYDGFVGTDIQPQGMTYDGFLYLSTGFSSFHSYKIQLRNDGTFQVVDDYKYNYTDYKNNSVTMEPESVFLIENYLYVGARSATEQYIVKFLL